MTRPIHAVSLSSDSFRRTAIAALTLLALGTGVLRGETPSTGFRYLGRYVAQPQDGADHLMGTAVVSDQLLAVASVTGIALVDRQLLASGTVDRPVSKYLQDPLEPSNVDGALIGPWFAPKFFQVVVSGDYLYASTRYDGLRIFELQGPPSAPEVVEVGRHMRPREFTESVKVAGDLLYLTHHADGIEVMDLSADPAHPVSLATLREPLIDAWGILPEDNGDIWVADGAAGLKLVRFDGQDLTFVAGDDLDTSPGTVFDAARVGDWIVTATGGAGITVYDRGTAAQVGTTALPGVCLDVEPLPDNRLAVACRGWVNVVEIDAAGQVRALGSKRLHRRFHHGRLSTHLGSQVTADGDTLYVAGWDEVSSYTLSSDIAEVGPDIQIVTQRAHFASPATTLHLELRNGGLATLHLDGVSCSVGLACSLQDQSVAPGDSTWIDLDAFDPDDLNAWIEVRSDDPDEPLLGIPVFASLAGLVDPGETAPVFSGPAGLVNAATGSQIGGFLSLSRLVFERNQVVFFTTFGTW